MSKKIVGAVVVVVAGATVITGVATAAVGIKVLLDNNIYDKEGFNNRGVNRQGYNKEGYNKEGYNKEGYNKKGYNKEGYDKEGYDKEGYNKEGYNKEDYDKKGYNKEGYNREGYNKKGFNQQGYNVEGLDCSNNDRGYYEQKIKEIEECLQKAYKQREAVEFLYALAEIRIGLEKGVKCIIEHEIGEKYWQDKLHDNIEWCLRCELLDTDSVEKLKSAKQHCNSALHDNSTEKTHAQVYFSHKVLEELKQEIQKYVD